MFTNYTIIRSYIITCRVYYFKISCGTLFIKSSKTCSGSFSVASVLHSSSAWICNYMICNWWVSGLTWPGQLTQPQTDRCSWPRHTRTRENKARMDLLDPKVSRQTLPVRPSPPVVAPSPLSPQAAPPAWSAPSAPNLSWLERMTREWRMAASADVWFWLSGSGRRVATDPMDTYNGFLQPCGHHSRHILGANYHALVTLTN